MQRKENSQQNTQQNASNGTVLTQQALLDKFGIFMERAFQNDPSLNVYLKEWESFKSLLKTTPLDYDKIYAHISKMQLVVSNNNSKSPTLNKVLTPEISKNEYGSAAQMAKYNSPSAGPNFTEKGINVAYTNSPELRSANSYIPRLNKAALLEKFHKLKDKMDQHTDRLIRITQKRDANFSSLSKFDDRTPLRRVVVYSKDQNQKGDMFKEIENKLNYIKESSYNNYRFLG